MENWEMNGAVLPVAGAQDSETEYEYTNEGSEEQPEIPGWQTVIGRVFHFRKVGNAYLPVAEVSCTGCTVAFNLLHREDEQVVVLVDGCPIHDKRKRASLNPADAVKDEDEGLHPTPAPMTATAWFESLTEEEIDSLAPPTPPALPPGRAFERLSEATERPRVPFAPAARTPARLRARVARFRLQRLGLATRTPPPPLD